MQGYDSILSNIWVSLDKDFQKKVIKAFCNCINAESQERRECHIKNCRTTVSDLCWGMNYFSWAEKIHLNNIKNALFLLIARNATDSF